MNFWLSLLHGNTCSMYVMYYYILPSHTRYYLSYPSSGAAIAMDFLYHLDIKAEILKLLTFLWYSLQTRIWVICFIIWLLCHKTVMIITVHFEPLLAVLWHDSCDLTNFLNFLIFSFFFAKKSSNHNCNLTKLPVMVQNER